MSCPDCHYVFFHTTFWDVCIHHYGKYKVEYWYKAYGQYNINVRDDHEQLVIHKLIPKRWEKLDQTRIEALLLLQ